MSGALSKDLLDPTERVSEILTGLIMVLAFTGSFSVATAGPAEVRSMFIGAFGCNLASGIVDGVFYMMDRLAKRGRGLEPAELPRFDKNDWLGAVLVCLLVVGSTFPVLIPFLFMHDGTRALRASHGISIVMMFFIGYVYGRNIGHRPWVVGFAMVLLGSALAGLTIVLGG